nr:FAD:protein FMN transferase [Curtanaerobium respiraculi]
MAQVLSDIPLEDEISIAGPDGDSRWTCSFFAFNTAIGVTAYADRSDPNRIRDVFHAVAARCRRLERLFSRFLPESDIMRLNNACGSWVAISRETYELLRASLRFCKASEGAFDITMGTVCALWDFTRGIIPDREDVEHALAHVDWHCIELREDGGCRTDSMPNVADTLSSEGTSGRYRGRMADPAAKLDVGGIAKGWIADDLQALMQSHGVACGIINLGGNALVFGEKPDGEPWHVGIRNPFETQQVLCALSISEGSVVTSGPYERFFEKGGRRYHHILSPRTGFPVETDLASASIISRRSIDGDGYSTTMFSLGSKRALHMVDDLPDIEALFVRSDGKILISRGLRLTDQSADGQPFLALRSPACI